MSVCMTLVAPGRNHWGRCMRRARGEMRQIGNADNRSGAHLGSQRRHLGSGARDIRGEIETPRLRIVCGGGEVNGLKGEGFRPGCRKPSLVEAGGQHIRGFRCGLDYAFILQAVFGLQDAERVMPQLHRVILVPARRRQASSASL
jgi:hypothetical protein